MHQTGAAEVQSRRGALHRFGTTKRKAFNDVAPTDPKCTMSLGVAMSLYHPLCAPPLSVELQRATAAMEKHTPASPITRADYVAASVVFSLRLTNRHRSGPSLTESAGQISLAIRRIAKPESSMRWRYWNRAADDKLMRIIDPQTFSTRCRR